MAASQLAGAQQRNAAARDNSQPANGLTLDAGGRRGASGN